MINDIGSLLFKIANTPLQFRSLALQDDRMLQQAIAFFAKR